ncbi:MAG: DUF1853 family protein [Flavobacteriia bacterium]|nr:DUF1853 family protein [Flavobacteriia bacterium]
MSAPTPKDLLRIADWILNSPPFFNIPENWNFNNDFARKLDQELLHSNLKFTSAVLHETRLRMGRIFERVVIALFNAHPDYEVLATGVGLFEEKRQLTELDILLRDENGKGLHLEVSVKFYLYLMENDILRVVGPNQEDVLENRMAKFSRQLDFGRAYVAKHFPEMTFDHRILSRGRIFQPQGEHYAHPFICKDAETGIYTAGEVPEDSFRLENRWEWISWPPKEGGYPLELGEEEMHGWRMVKGAPQHVIVLPA